ncbi:MAG: sugar ABC transporter permease [Clostridia bacterium]|nr:sugar ABC transporter permease [Clostridia bacterium]
MNKERSLQLNKPKFGGKWTKSDVQVFLMSSVGLLFLIVFSYLPMFGIVLAFKDGDLQLNILNAILRSDWVGLDNFKAFFVDPNFYSVLWNTLGLNILMLLITFPITLIFALLMCEVRHRRYRNALQTVVAFPHFISWTIFAGMFIAMADMSTGILNPILEALGIMDAKNPSNLLEARYFWSEIIICSVIKDTGWSCIIYVAAIGNIDPCLYEAAKLDGANRVQVALKITLPMISSTITVFLLLAISRLLSNSFEQFYAFQNITNLDKSEVIATYVYKMGISNRRYSYTSALGLFNSVVAIVLLAGSNFVSKKLTGRGIL